MRSTRNEERLRGVVGCFILEFRGVEPQTIYRATDFYTASARVQQPPPPRRAASALTSRATYAVKMSSRTNDCRLIW
jgi:hypothetical protein